MATVSQWNPFGVALDITATAGVVTRTSASQYTVVLNVSWETHWSGSNTNYGMTASSGSNSISLATAGDYNSNGSGSFTGAYSISGNASSVATVTVTFTNFSPDGKKSATKTIDLSVSVPALTSYTVSYNANGGSGAPSSQTKWKDQTLKLSTALPIRTGYEFQGWATSSGGSAVYAAGANYTNNASITLYASWRAITYTVSYNANGGSGAPGNQTKTYGVNLVLSSTKPTRTNYTFKGWGVSSSSTTVSYAAGATYTSNASITLYAIWELSYTKPRIMNLSVARCDSSGTLQNDGNFCLINFSWACDRANPSILIQTKYTTDSAYAGGLTLSGSGTSGTISRVLNGYNTASSYNIKVTVTDSGGATELITILSSQLFTIHARPGGNGIAFGKMSEEDNMLETNWDIEMYDNMIYRNGLAYFGLGSGPTHDSIKCNDINAAIDTGWYITYANTANLPSITGMYYAVVRVESRGNYVYQTLVSADGFSNVTKLIRHSKDGGNVWDEWEWINPPMAAGVEYRTIERWNDKPVYRKLINVGTLPGRNGISSINHGANAAYILRVCGVVSDGSTIPYSYSFPLIWVSATKTSLVIGTADNAYGDYSNHTGYVQIWYTKA